MGDKMRAPFVLSGALAALMGVQAALGLALPGEYRDPAWIRAVWFGNDWFTLVVATPALAASLWRARRGSPRAHLLWLGLLAFAAYNYAYYMLGAALNAFFPLYVVPLVLSGAALVLALSRTDPGRTAARFRTSTPVRAIGGYLVFTAAGLTAVWAGAWAAYAFAGRPTPVETEAFKLVAALDLSLMVPALAAGGVLLWRRSSWGYVIATVAGIQASLYLVVLTIGSVVMIRRGLAQAPGEVPVWGTLALLTLLATAVLLGSITGERRPGGDHARAVPDRSKARTRDAKPRGAPVHH
jgi:hypothetical protein